ncbi:MAG: hypothetical protein LQ344_003911 [Seirophora lacunosa]|nr:MAG: hypothetical protein LQ344_003911 [Seirophora lacunosa]
MRHLLPSSATLFDCCTRRLPQSRAQWLPRYRIRYLHISTTTVNADRTIVAEPANTANATTPGLITRSSGSGHGVPTNEVIDARFEVSDSPLPLLNVSLSASQKLYTRRGTLVGVGGKAENVSLLAAVSPEILILPPPNPELQLVYAPTRHQVLPSNERLIDVENCEKDLSWCTNVV